MTFSKAAIHLAVVLFISGSAIADNTQVITVMGNVVSGTDQLNIFGFGVNASLAGKPFIVTYTFAATTAPLFFNTNCVSGFLTTFGLCQSGSSHLSGTTVMRVGNNTPYIDLNGGEVSRQTQGWWPTHYITGVGSFAAFQIHGNALTTETGSTPDFDWRSPFFDEKFSILKSSTGSFLIFANDGLTQTSGVLAPTSIRVSKVPCTVEAVELNINNTTGKQPNIVGGNVVVFDTPTHFYGNRRTTVDVTVTPVSFALTPVSFGDKETGGAENDDPYNIRFTSPTLPNQLLSVGAIPDPKSGKTTMQYFTNYGGGIYDSFNDEIVASACGTQSKALKIYEYFPYLDEAHIFNFDMGESRVDDATFVKSSDLTAEQIQTFLENVTSGPDPSFLAAFYFVKTDPNGANTGFFDANGDGEYHAKDDEPYCSNGSTTCVAEGTKGTPDMLASHQIAEVATDKDIDINPKVILTTLQKESGILTSTTLPSKPKRPSYVILNAAMGTKVSCTIGDKRISLPSFLEQIKCGAATLSDLFDDNKFDDDNKEAKYPFFFPANKTEIKNYNSPPCDENNPIYPCTDVVQSIQYSWEPKTFDPETKKSLSCNRRRHNNCAIVGFWMKNAATRTQYNYTPFVQTTAAETRGGVYSFEYWWLRFNNNGWYQP